MSQEEEETIQIKGSCDDDGEDILIGEDDDDDNVDCFGREGLGREGLGRELLGVFLFLETAFTLELLVPLLVLVPLLLVPLLLLDLGFCKVIFPGGGSSDFRDAADVVVVVQHCVLPVHYDVVREIDSRRHHT